MGFEDHLKGIKKIFDVEFRGLPYPVKSIEDLERVSKIKFDELNPIYT